MKSVPQAQDDNSSASLETLDFLRGVAAVYVLINHVRGNFFVGGAALMNRGDLTMIDFIAISALQATSLGTEFVVLFFVLSGYSMANSLQYSPNPVMFYLKRLIRIWPPYLVATGLAVVVAAVIGNDAFNSPRRVLEVAFYLKPSSEITPQFWSLPYEIVFYIICPLILTSFSRVNALLAASALMTGIAIIVAGAALNPFRNFFLNFLGNELLFFAAGAYTYYKIRLIPALAPIYLWAVCAILIALTLTIKIVVGGSNILSSILMVLAAILLIRNFPRSFATNTRLNVGRFSYSLYIYHFALIALIKEFAEERLGLTQASMTSYLGWVLVVPPVMLACWVLYLVTEKQSNAVVALLRRRERQSAEARIGISD